MSQTELDAALATMKGDVDGLVGAVNDLVAKVEAGASPTDLTGEIATLKDAAASLESSKAEADAALNPPPAAPADAGAPADTTATDTTATDTPPAG